MKREEEKNNEEERVNYREKKKLSESEYVVGRRTDTEWSFLSLLFDCSVCYKEDCKTFNFHLS